MSKGAHMATVESVRDEARCEVAAVAMDVATYADLKAAVESTAAALVAVDIHSPDWDRLVDEHKAALESAIEYLEYYFGQEATDG